jgi:pimeloyl-ACP methyl ester carboxylesterase
MQTGSGNASRSAATRDPCLAAPSWGRSKRSRHVAFDCVWEYENPLLPRNTTHNLPAGGFFDARGVKLPVAVSAFAEEIYQAPQSWAEKAYVKLIHYNRFPKGTHFAAWEQPELFVGEMRASFKSLR